MVPAICVFYATARLIGVPIVWFWPSILLLLLALLAEGIYVSITNDIADRECDTAAGKANRSLGMSRAMLALIIAATLAVGAAISFTWRDSPWLMGTYLSAWLVFTLYSLPPFRLKERGLLGVLADAAGAHLFPALVAVLLAYRAAVQPPDPMWVGIVGVWAFANGVRGILWHQLADLEHDRAAGVRTFAQRHSRQAVTRLAGLLVFPLEAVALGLIVWKLCDPVILGSLIGYTALVWGRVKLGHPAVIVETEGNHVLILQEFYHVMLPLGILASSAWHYPADIVMIFCHIVIFPQRIRETLGRLQTGIALVFRPMGRAA